MLRVLLVCDCHRLPEALELVRGIPVVVIGDERLRPSGAQADRHAKLTARESEVLDLLARGMSTVGVAEALVVSTETVRCHVKRILRKLGVRSRADAVSAVYGDAA